MLESESPIDAHPDTTVAKLRTCLSKQIPASQENDNPLQQKPSRRISAEVGRYPEFCVSSALPRQRTMSHKDGTRTASPSRPRGGPILNPRAKNIDVQKTPPHSASRFDREICCGATFLTQQVLTHSSPVMSYLYRDRVLTNRGQ